MSIVARHRLSPALAVLALALGVAAPPALAENEASNTEEKEVEVVPAPPPGWDSKRPLGLADFRRKKQRGYFTGLPLANFDPSTGFGGGARGYYFHNGSRDNPLFAYTPYLHRVFAQFFFTTGGLQYHWLDYDVPSIAGTEYRLRSQMIFLRNTAHHFFGLGEEAMAPLTFTGATQTYGSFADYTDQLEMVRGDGTTLSRYDQYDLIRPFGFVSLERTFLRGVLRPLIGLGFNHTTVRDYSGKQVDAVGPGGEAVMATMGTTRLKEHCDRGEISGCSGGWHNFVRIGLSFDTRDFEPDPNRGIFVDTSLDLGTPLLGSDFTYARFLLSGRVFYSPMPHITDLVLGARATFQMQRGVPFFSKDVIPYTEDTRSGLGGIRTLRGFRQNRFVGDILTLLNVEARWTFYRFVVWRQKLALMAVLFGDTGRVYDDLSDLSFERWRRGQGVAFRVAWNQATIVTMDYGTSSEDSGLYINFNQQF